MHWPASGQTLGNLPTSRKGQSEYDDDSLPDHLVSCDASRPGQTLQSPSASNNIGVNGPKSLLTIILRKCSYYAAPRPWCICVTHSLTRSLAPSLTACPNRHRPCNATRKSRDAILQPKTRAGKRASGQKGRMGVSHSRTSLVRCKAVSHASCLRCACLMGSLRACQAGR